MYADSDPVNKADPTGLFSGGIGEFGVSIVIVGLIMATAYPVYGEAQLKLSIIQTLDAKSALAEARALSRELVAGRWLTNYETWFGPLTFSNALHVRTGWQKIAMAANERIEFVGHGEHCNVNTIAYVFPRDNKLRIWLCKRFFDLPTYGTNPLRKEGVIIHELSHEVHDTVDDVYGVMKSKQIAGGWPERAIENADNYAFQATANY